MSTFNELIDFTRSTTGTYLDSVVYGDELVTNGDFATDSDWTKGAGWTISGGKANQSGGSNFGDLSQYVATTAGKTYLLTAQVSSYVTGEIDVKPSTVSANWFSGNGTIRHIFVALGTTTRIDADPRNSQPFTGSIDNISVKEVIGGQVSGTPLLRTAAINEPRLEYDASGNPLGLLIEEARTNLVTYSDLSSGWNWVNTTDIGGAATAPDGTQTATLMRENTAGTAHIAFAAIVSASTSTTASIFAKAGGRRYLQLTDSTNQPNWAMFDLEQGVVTEQKSSGITATIEPYGNGWYRCNAALTLPASGSTTNFVWGSSILATTNGIRNVYQGDGTSGIYLWGGQVETGAFPTSYIPTSGSTVTRAADVASVPVERFAFNDTKGSVVVSASSFANLTGSNNGYVAVLSDGTSNNRMQVVLRDSSQGFITGGLGLLDAGSVAQSQTTKIAMAVKTNDAGLSLNGGAVVTATSGNIPSPITDLRLGGRTALDSATLCGHIKQIQYYPKRLSNEELQLLTQPSASPTMNLTFDGQATSTLVEGLHD